MDKITFHMASFPARESALEESVKSILPQCDELHVYLNDYDHVPSFLKDARIKVYLSQEEIGDLGDVGKFFGCNKWKGYVFTVDDKIIYPENYASTMISAIEASKRQAVISLHGRIMKPNCTSYYHDFTEAFRCLDSVQINSFAHVLGTGVLAWHTDTFKIKFSAFESINMSDIWFSKALQEANVPGLILKHRARWIKLSNLQDNRISISGFCSHNDEMQTKVANAVLWTIRKCPFTL
jgi:hypothetical protein